MTDYGFRENAGSSSSAIKLRIYFWNPSLLLDAADFVATPSNIPVNVDTAHPCSVYRSTMPKCFFNAAANAAGVRR